MITDATALLAWIETALPPVDPEIFGPWLAAPAGRGAVAAEVYVRVESAGRVTQSVTVSLSTHPVTAGRIAL